MIILNTNPYHDDDADELLDDNEYAFLKTSRQDDMSTIRSSSAENKGKVALAEVSRVKDLTPY